MKIHQAMKQELKSRTNNPIYHFFTPARINLIGEHIDYVGGKVIPATINLGIEAFASKSENIEIKSLNFGQDWHVDNNHFAPKDFRKKAKYFNFVYGVIDQLRPVLNPKMGFKLILHSTIPIASGLSSSAAFGILIINVFCQIYEIKLSHIEKAKIFQSVENKFMGLKSGIMDQWAILLGKKNNFLELDTTSLKYQYLRANQQDYKFLLLSTNKKRELISSEYNNRIKELTKISKILKLKFKKLSSLRDLKILKRLQDPVLQKRLKHIITECQRSKTVAQKLKNIKGKELGLILNASHMSLDQDYEVCAPEANFIHQELTKLPGVFGSRMIGAGFGGCLLAVVNKDFRPWKINFKAKYFQKFKLPLDIYEFKIGDGAGVIND